MQLKMLVLPAPFGPMIAKRSPAATSTLTPARAATPPKLRCNPSRASSAMRAYALPRSGEGHAHGPPAVSMTDECVERLSGNSILGITPPRLDGRLLHKWRDATLTRRACQYIGRRDPPVRPPTTGSRQRARHDRGGRGLLQQHRLREITLGHVAGQHRLRRPRGPTPGHAGPGG